MFLTLLSTHCPLLAVIAAVIAALLMFLKRGKISSGFLHYQVGQDRPFIRKAVGFVLWLYTVSLTNNIIFCNKTDTQKYWSAPNIFYMRTNKHFAWLDFSCTFQAFLVANNQRGHSRLKLKIYIYIKIEEHYKIIFSLS